MIINDIDYTENLFSYGTLRYESVQLSKFRRRLKGKEDTLLGYRLTKIQITDPDVIAKSGDTVHPVIEFSGNLEDTVQGTVFEISQEELHQADLYEVADYKRVLVRLLSGKTAWVYVSTETINRLDSFPQ